MSALAAFSGSPPRAWGRRPRGRRRPRRWRFTPTCVGTASVGCLRCSTQPVHPHVRGDGELSVVDKLVFGGSPPRAWGRRTTCPALARSGRFTPTCVGTARPARPSWSSVSVHPHVRGDGFTNAYGEGNENGSPPRAWGRRQGRQGRTTGVGSPPRAWGRHDDDEERHGVERFTPTCVGTATT